jgi:[calcium/calmodulin-dependent protein kinase] kinase
MKAVKKFKRLTDPTKAQTPQTPMESILGGEGSYFVEPPMEMDPDEPFPAVGEAPHGSSLRAGVRKVFRHPFAAFRDHGAPGSSDSASISSRPEHSANSSQRPSGVFEEGSDSPLGHASPYIPSRTSSATTKRSMEGTRGHARDPLEEEFPYLFIGPSTYTGSQEPEVEMSDEPASVFEEPDTLDAEPEQFVSESPGAAEFNIYETAYRSELERIKQSQKDKDRNTGPKVYLTRRVENKDEVMKLAKEKALDLQIGQRFTFAPSRTASSIGSAVSALRSQMLQKRQAEQVGEAATVGDAAGGQDHQPHLHPPSVTSQGIPGPEPSSLEATGVSSASGEDSKSHLRRLLDRGNE